MTEPSLRWRLTFFPRKDLATFKFKLSTSLSPLPLLVGYLTPATPTNGEFFALEKYVYLDVIAFAVLIPWVSTMLHSHAPC